MKRLIVIGGATATGKTALAIRLARHFDTCILSADSRQFFREMSIGTAKPGPAELASAPHYFIDNRSIAEDYSVGDFERDAMSMLESEFRQKDTAILVGGSGLYVKAVCEGLDNFPPVDDATRAFIEDAYKKGGLEWMQERLKYLDPAYYEIVDRQNPARMRRALEVCLATGRPYSGFRQQERPARPFQPVYLLLEKPRAALYETIDRRVDQMLQQGLEEEARSLIPYRYKPALKTVGYEEFFDYFDGKADYPTTVEKIKQHSRNYAKRQATWFRKYGDWQVFSPEDWSGISAFLETAVR